jgi:hypothetical protein
MTHESLCEQLSTELEQEYLSRFEEINKVEEFFETRKRNDDISDIMRKSLIILLYAHYEGYCKRAFQFYVLYINKKEIQVSDVKYGIAAVNMQREFKKLFNTSSKPVRIKTYLEDGALQFHGRKRDFLNDYDCNIRKTIELKEDFISSEGNLKPDVLRKILFQLELDCSIVDTCQSEIYKLVNIRNSLVHGDHTRCPDQNEYDRYREAALSTMKNVKALIEKAFEEQAYLKAV